MTKGAFLTRTVDEDGVASWCAKDRYLIEYEQQRYEEAYQLGQVDAYEKVKELLNATHEGLHAKD